MKPMIFSIALLNADSTLDSQLIYLVIALGVSALLGWILEKYMCGLWRRKTKRYHLILPVAAAVLLILRFGFEMQAVKGFILCLLLLFAANSDICTREVSDSISVMIFITGLIGISVNDLPMLLLAMVVITLPQVAVVLLKPGSSYGGGDIKIMAACSFLLGLNRGLFAMVSGLLLAILYSEVIHKVKHKSRKESIPLVAYLAAGSFAAYLI